MTYNPPNPRNRSRPRVARATRAGLTVATLLLGLLAFAGPASAATTADLVQVSNPFLSGGTYGPSAGGHSCQGMNDMDCVCDDYTAYCDEGETCHRYVLSNCISGRGGI